MPDSIIKIVLSMALVVGLPACSTVSDLYPPTEPPVEEVLPTVEILEPVKPVTPPATVKSDASEKVQAPGGTPQEFIRHAGEDRVYFEYDSHQLTSKANYTLRRQAYWLRTYPNVYILVAGNADERGTREYNLALGARRADSVKSFLTRQGVSAHRITTVSYGKERPIDGRSNEGGWARNRNGHTVIVSSNAVR